MIAQENGTEELNLYQIQMEEQRKAEIEAIELQEKRHKVNNEWCDMIGFIFEKYQNDFQETAISTPETTARILKRNGVQIEGIEQKDIYQGFNVVIQDDHHIEDYLKKQRGKYGVEMPY